MAHRTASSHLMAQGRASAGQRQAGNEEADGSANQTKMNEGGAGGWKQSALYAWMDVEGDSDDEADDLPHEGGRLNAPMRTLPAADATHSQLWGEMDEPMATESTSDGVNAHNLWQKTLGELQLQLASSTYYTWLHNTWVEAYEDGDLIVGTANTYARDWLDNRLKGVVRRTLKSIAGRTLDVQFIVAAQRERGVVASPVSPAPLYQPVEEETPRDSLADFRPAQVEARVSLAEARTPRSAPASAQLNPKYSFDSFVVGSSNRLATAAAQAVAERPGYKFNPLFVHGGVGLGKTHLLHAIGNALVERGLAVLYVTSEQFTNDLIAAIRAQNTEGFRNKYRALDALLIDDIQFISGKESTQEEVFHTFNHLQQLGKQVVLSSDRPPRALQLLEERLRSRFEGGIRVDISAPDYETRVAILQSKAQRMGIDVPADVLNLIAERVDSNIRELEGALNHLFLQAQLTRSRLDMPLAATSLEHVAPHRRPCAPSRLIELVAAALHQTPEELVGSRRTKPIADARHVAMYLLREDSGLSLPQIGALFGGRDHTTVAHGVAKITEEMRRDEQLRALMATLREKIYTHFGA